jgi:hypothetical protein
MESPALSLIQLPVGSPLSQGEQGSDGLSLEKSQLSKNSLRTSCRSEVNFAPEAPELLVKTKVPSRSNVPKRSKPEAVMNSNIKTDLTSYEVNPYLGRQMTAWADRGIHALPGSELWEQNRLGVYRSY